MQDADKSRGAAAADTVGWPERDSESVSRYAHSRRVGELLAAATMTAAYRAGRAGDPRRPTRRSGTYCRIAVALAAVGCACLIVTAVTGAAWLLAVVVGVAGLAAALAA